MSIGAVVWLICLSASAWCETNWNPKRTWVLIVSALEWKYPDVYPSFPKNNRRDQRLVQALAVQGVPNEQMVVLKDGAATLKQIQTDLNSILTKAQQGDSLWIYYAGHGDRDQATQKFYMVPYDGYEADTLWSQDEAAAAIDKCGKQLTVFWAADCCYSGCLADWAQQGNTRPRAAYASSSRELVSTENWTFSDCLIDGLIGNPVADLNDDGQITAQEIGQWIQKGMRFVEGQSAGLTVSSSFSDQTILAKSTRPKRKSEGRFVKVLYQEKYWKARVIEEQGSRVKVHWVGNVTDYPDEWVPLRNVIWMPSGH
jgi:hypothetical protein